MMVETFPALGIRNLVLYRLLQGSSSSWSEAVLLSVISHHQSADDEDLRIGWVPVSPEAAELRSPAVCYLLGTRRY
jgi:hypothetical protein